MVWQEGPSHGEIVGLAMLGYLFLGTIPHLIVTLLTSSVISMAVLRRVRRPRENFRYGITVGLKIGGFSIGGVLMWLFLCIPIAASFPSSSEDYWAVIFGGLSLIAILAMSALLWFPLRERYPAPVARRNMVAVMAAILLIPGIWAGWTAMMVYVFHLDDRRGYGGPLGWKSTEVMVWWLVSLIGVLVTGIWSARKLCHTAAYVVKPAE